MAVQIYFSQYEQDKFIDQVVLNKKREGFFVDIGAHDGISLSNSYFFEKERNFGGVCIEPNPSVFEQLTKNRTCSLLNVCIAAEEKKVKFLTIQGYSEMLSGIVDQYHPDHLQRIDNYIAAFGGGKKEIEVDAIPLHRIKELDGKKIDFISIDTEGNELNILNSLDFSKFKVKCFTIENNYGDKKIDALMSAKGYLKVYRLGDDDIYLLKKKYSIGFRIRRRLFLSRSKKIDNSVLPQPIK